MKSKILLFLKAIEPTLFESGEPSGLIYPVSGAGFGQMILYLAKPVHDVEGKHSWVFVRSGRIYSKLWRNT